MNDRLIPITDTQGRVLVPGDDIEPLPGSIVLTEGPFGTAWQRFFSDGLWHSVGHGSLRLTWEQMLHHRNLVLVYDAPERGGR